ncbi:hypothetical protein HU147_02915 [Planomicrobium chinense]|uniref:hypothetical protein n=1 Tax=Planococcus chinensis TaxID=272917 RepID=UPI001CC5FBCE|nr:hypothetical protein [Planococcus chinensis]MBZ5200159.1 hypothetical protein [Planococcus chinensis]
MKRKVATPAGTARAEDPGLSSAKEAAEAVPAESVHLERNGLKEWNVSRQPEERHLNEQVPFLF